MTEITTSSVLGISGLVALSVRYACLMIDRTCPQLVLITIFLMHGSEADL